MSVMGNIFTQYRQVLTVHPNMMPLAGRRLNDGNESGLAFLIQQGFSKGQAVELLQSLTAFVVGFSLFSSRYVETGIDGLSQELGTYMTNWRDETCAKTLRVIMKAFEEKKEPGSV